MTEDELSGEGVAAPIADGIDWAAVRHDYLYSGMAQRRIAYKHGMSAARLRRLAGRRRKARMLPSGDQHQRGVSSWRCN